MSTFFQISFVCALRKNISFAVLAAMIFFSSCSVTKPGNYFKNITKDTTITNTAGLPTDLKIKANDVLSISISSISLNEDLIYNSKTSGSDITTTVAPSSGFPVSSDGYISIHNLGKVKVAGLSRKELKIILEKQLQPFLKDPLVIIDFASHHVTIVGEIAKPQIFNITDEKLSIIDLLAQSGSLTGFSKLSDVMVIREKDNGREFKHLNLEDHSIFTSSYYYLQPNDVVVVSQDQKIVKKQSDQENYRQYSSIIFQALSTAVIIYQVFFRR